MSGSGASGAPSSRGSAARLWGDGFAGDDFAASRTMTDWSRCSPDEYAILFTKLMPADTRFPAALLRHLESCVAARVLRLSSLDTASAPVEVRSSVPDKSVAAALQSTWFAPDGAVARGLRQLGLIRPAPERMASERRLLAVLDDVLHRIQSGSHPSFTEDREVWFAFGSGIHPAYLWPESAITPARGFTAAWLGHLDRGRTALMPEPVADYLVDAVLDETRSVDRTLVLMVGASDNLRRLRRAALLRLEGGDPTVRFARGGQRHVAMVGGLRPAAPVREDALEHA